MILSQCKNENCNVIQSPEGEESLSSFRVLWFEESLSSFRGLWPEESHVNFNRDSSVVSLPLSDDKNVSFRARRAKKLSNYFISSPVGVARWGAPCKQETDAKIMRRPQTESGDPADFRHLKEIQKLDSRASHENDRKVVALC